MSNAPLSSRSRCPPPEDTFAVFACPNSLIFLEILVKGAVPLSRETGFSPWEEGRDTKVVLRDSRYGL